MASKKKTGYIERFLKRADRAIEDGVKKADEVLEDAVEFGAMTAKQASKTSKELKKQAEKEGGILQKKGINKIIKGITTAKNLASSPEDDVALLEKLGELRKSKIITEKEFQEKKKKILDRI